MGREDFWGVQTSGRRNKSVLFQVRESARRTKSLCKRPKFREASIASGNEPIRDRQSQGG